MDTLEAPPPDHQPAPAAPGGWGRLRKLARAHRGKSILGGLFLCLVVLLFSMDALLAGPMRNWAERKMNSNLNGYTVHIGRVRPHLWRGAFDLDDLVLLQNSHPEPAVANFGALQFALQLRQLLRFKIAGKLTIVRPALHINLTQIKAEASSHVSLKGRGWQRAVEAIFPFKLDWVVIQDGSLLYLSDDTASKPLQLTRVFMTAQNVRNKAADKSTFPSPVTLDAVLFDTGQVGFTGAADFLREPFVGARGDIRLIKVPLDRLSPIAQNFQLKSTGGFLTLDGSIEYTPEAQLAHFRDVLCEDLRVDYVTSAATKAVEVKHEQQAVKLAKNLRNQPRVVLQLDTLRMTNGQIGFENKAATPPYRLFISKASLELTNLSNQGDAGRSTFHSRGDFMGSGTTVISGGARPTASPADFDVHLKLDDAKLPALNGFLQAHAGVDVAEGLFSVYSEITVKNGRMEGYVKPLIKNLKIYDRQKDKEKPFGKRVEMHVLQFLAYLFRNHSSQAVATVVRISGPTGGPKTNEWEVIRKLIGNGLSHAILPGFQGKPKEPGPPKAAQPVLH